MVNWQIQSRQRQAGRLRLVIAVAALLGAPASRAQLGSGFAGEASHPTKHARELGKLLSSKPSQAPAFSIPVEPLGFTAPGPLYLGQRNSLTSLDFIDENRLLFTFRVPGLMRRAAGEASDERQIRAVVLALPGGTVESEALWTVHDRARYLWMFRDGHFLLRDRDLLEEGSAALELKPFLRFPGPLTWLEIDPSEQYLVTNSEETATIPPKPGDMASPPSVLGGQGSPVHPGTPGTPPAAATRLLVDGQSLAENKNIVVRILRRDSGQVMLFSRTRSSVHLPISSEGYLESLHGNGAQWLLIMNYFTGGDKILGHVDSMCSPTLDFVSPHMVLATICDRSGGRKLVAVSTNGRRLWEDANSALPVWPLLVKSPDGTRMARESLAVTHPISASAPLDRDDIKGQEVEVFDAATGKVALTATASPVLDAGGNVAISPSGQRVAIISEGAIQVFELPAPAPLP